LDINGMTVGDFDVGDAESFMNEVATNGEIEIASIAGKLSSLS
jgi:death on curing protein